MGSSEIFQRRFTTLEEASQVVEELLNERTMLLDRIRSLMYRLEQADRQHQKSSLQLMYDSITGLPNHARMDKDIGSLLWDFFNMPEPPQISLLLVRLDDNFHHIKQSFNEDVFNNILYTIADRLKETLGQRGLLYHPRIDEFAVFVFDTLSTDELTSLSYEIRASIESTINNQVYKVKIGCWIGIANFPDDALNKRMLLSNADIALAQAIASNAKTIFFQEDMRNSVVGTLEMQDNLLSAIEVKTISQLNDNFALFFQPILSVEEINEDGIICNGIKAEVLIRWKDPNRGNILPRNLIEVAEETGLILPIGRWLLKAAMLKLVEWQKDYSELKLSVNISPRQFYSRSFSTELENLLEETGVNASGIYLEITESCLFNDQEFAIEEIERLNRLGFCIALDDFGTGYSSLGYLDSFKADVLKIDQVFTEGLDNEGKKRDIIKSIVSIGQELGMDIIFEGIEEPDQLRKAYNLGCRVFQGFLLSRPLPEEQFRKFMENSKDNFIKFPH